MRLIQYVVLIVFFSLPSLAFAQDATTPIWRLFDGTQHFYTTDCQEAENAEVQYKFWLEFDNQMFILTRPVGNAVPFYRFFGGNRHFYTTSPNAEGAPGFVKESTLGFVYTSGNINRTALYRTYSPKTNDHFYTTSKDEADQAVAAFGNVSEGTGAFLPAGGDHTCIPRVLYTPSPPPAHGGHPCGAIGGGPC